MDCSFNRIVHYFKDIVHFSWRDPVLALEGIRQSQRREFHPSSPMTTPSLKIPELPSTVDLEQMKVSFGLHGYAVARGLFAKEEVAEFKAAFDRIAANGPIPGLFEPVPADLSGGDPLKEFPRVHHPHRFDPISRKHLVHPGMLACLRELMADDVLAAQSMFYFNPPGARGQAMHQDNFYLLV